MQSNYIETNYEIILNENQASVLELLKKKRKNINGAPVKVPEATSSNFLTIFQEDEHFSNVRFNGMSFRPELIENDVTREWL